MTFWLFGLQITIERWRRPEPEPPQPRDCRPGKWADEDSVPITSLMYATPGEHIPVEAIQWTKPRDYIKVSSPLGDYQRQYLMDYQRQYYGTQPVVERDAELRNPPDPRRR